MIVCVRERERVRLCVCMILIRKKETESLRGGDSVYVIERVRESMLERE